MKGRGLIVLSFLSILIVFSTSISALSISVKPSASCTDSVVLSLSDTTNAHGELWDQGNYAQVLCADFAASNACDPDGKNKIIGLSGDTNGHGEIPGLDNYDSDVCYGAMRCVNVTHSPETLPINRNCPSTEPINVLSLSSDTNAHLGIPKHYDTSVCCTVIGEPYAFWSSGQGAIDELTFVPGETELTLVMREAEGATVDFEIWRDDPISDNKIETRLGISVDANSKATTKVILGGGYSGGEEYYFIVKHGGPDERSTTNLLLSEKSQAYCDLKSACSTYEIDSCSSDVCGIAKDELNEVPGVNCYDGGTNCFCEFNTTANACAPRYTTFTFDSEGREIIGESCEITIKNPDNNGCADGKIEYTYENSCDPGNIRTNTVACPAEIQLPFFGFSNFLITVIAIAFIYYFMYNSTGKRKR